jgi:hypothetical protein
MRLHDGIEAWDWPELASFLAAIGLPPPVRPKRFRPDGFERKLVIRVVVGEPVLGTRHVGYEVYHMPAFRALCSRLGIPHEAMTVSLEIVLSEGEMPTARHVYALHDVPSPEPICIS